MYTIRRYKPSDKEKLRYICKETAWESYKNDPVKLETVPIIYNDYFTENEPENIFVAANENDEAVGYVICSTDYELFKAKMRTDIKKRVSETRKFELWQIYFFLFVMRSLPSEYTTHLHIDILPEYQHMGVGTNLIKALSAHLSEKGEKYMSVCSVSKTSDGYKFYNKFGFKKIKSHGFGAVSMTYKTIKENEQ